MAIVRQVFAEEHLAYRLDEKGGVHPLVDLAFELQRVSVIQALAGARYQHTLGLFENSHAALEAGDPKTALGRCFEAVEHSLSLMFGSGRTLTGAIASTNFEPMLVRRYNGDPVSHRAARQLLRSLADWIDGAHNFRHAPGVEEPTTVDPEIAIAYLTGNIDVLCPMGKEKLRRPPLLHLESLLVVQNRLDCRRCSAVAFESLFCDAMTEASGEQRGLDQRNHNPRVGGSSSLLRYQRNQGLSSKTLRSLSCSSNQLATFLFHFGP